MKFYSNKYLLRYTYLVILFISIINIKAIKLYAEETYLKDIEIDSSTKSEGNSLEVPTNPFQIVEMIRRANSMNDATKPSDAIDDALNSFTMIEDK